MTLKLCCEESPTCNKSKEFLKKHDSLIRKQTLTEVLKELVRRVTDINEDYDSMEDLQLWLEQKLKELSK